MSEETDAQQNGRLLWAIAAIASVVIICITVVAIFQPENVAVISGVIGIAAGGMVTQLLTHFKVQRQLAEAVKSTAAKIDDNTQVTKEVAQEVKVEAVKEAEKVAAVAVVAAEEKAKEVASEAHTVAVQTNTNMERLLKAVNGRLDDRLAELRIGKELAETNAKQICELNERFDRHAKNNALHLARIEKLLLERGQL